MSSDTITPPTTRTPLRHPGGRVGSVRASRFEQGFRWYAAYLLVLGLLAVLLVFQASRPDEPFALAVAALLVTGVLALFSPRHGLYLTTFFALLGDSVFSGWFPFAKNFSSSESVLFLHDRLIVSPLELCLVALALAVLVRRLIGQPLQLRGGTLLTPVLVFTGLAGVALAYGIARGGDVNIALWEVRPMAYLLLLYLAASVLLTRREHYLTLLLVAAAALGIEAAYTATVILTSSDPAIEALYGLGYLEHSASMHFNTVFVWLLAMAVFRDRSVGRKLFLWLLLPGLTTAYLLAERRSAMVALALAVILLGAVLHQRRPGVFWLVAPVVTVVGVAFIAATWNASGALGMPATAAKSVIAPEQLNDADASSNLYRIIETYNLVFTIRARPLLGSGFGHPFIQFIGLPYLPFAWADYFPHNSVLWIWINMGLGGMLSMLALFGTAVRDGARSLRDLPPRDAAMMFVATSFVAMYIVFAYVDIAWDTQSMVYLGLLLALIANLPSLPGDAPDHDASTTGDEPRGADPEASRPLPTPVRSTTPVRAPAGSS